MPIAHPDSAVNRVKQKDVGALLSPIPLLGSRIALTRISNSR